MAKRMNQTTTLKITRITSTTNSGKENHDFINLSVNPKLEDDDLLAVGTKLASLQALPISDIGRIDSCALGEE